MRSSDQMITIEFFDHLGGPHSRAMTPFFFLTVGE
jgi:hypothetical protein